MPDAIILPFPTGGVPLEKALCSDCENAYFGPRGIFCAEFNEPIMFEDVAQECEMFDPILPPEAA